MIKILNNTEKIATQNLWKKIFKEDTENFLNYYYTEKIRDNHIFAKYIKDNIVSMLHLNPYSVLINNNISKIYYIVAVATLENHRKKGYMAELLNSSINFMNYENIPFTFLRPAKEEIYTPFDFRYIYNHNFLKLKKDYNLKELPLNQDNYNFLCDFINNNLKQKFNIFSKRTPKYIETLHKEVKSENGDIILLYNNDFVGCYIYWGNENKIIRGIFSNSDIYEIKETKPLVMARIVNLSEFFKYITSKNDDTTLTIQLNDDIIKENNGIFEININKNNSNIKKLENNINPMLILNISDLTMLMFGYKNISQFTNNKDTINIFKNINLYNVFLDEEV